jgi:hypothetical protein
MPTDFSADPLVSSMLRRSRRRPVDDTAGPLPPPAWGEAAPAAPGQSLPELCEPLFLLVCRVSRAARLGSPPAVDLIQNAARVRAEVLRILHSAAATAAATEDRVGGAGLGRVRRPLELFVDDVMSRHFNRSGKRGDSGADNGADTGADNGADIGAESGGANAWLPLAEPGPGFFVLLDFALVETDAGSAERLMIFYTCLALGFAGSGADADRPTEPYLAKLTARLGSRFDSDETTPICAGAYRHTDRRPLSEPVGGQLAALVLVAAALVLLVLSLNGTLYFLRVGSLQRDLDTFRQAASAATPATASLHAGNGQGTAP